MLWLEPGGQPPLSPYEPRLGDRHILTWHFIGVEVYKLSAQSLLTTALLGLAALVAFTQEAREIATVERAAQFVKAHAASGEVEELEALPAVFGGRFGALPAEVGQAIEGADTATLQALPPQSGTATLAELRARLGV